MLHVCVARPAVRVPLPGRRAGVEFITTRTTGGETTKCWTTTGMVCHGWNLVEIVVLCSVSRRSMPSEPAHHVKVERRAGLLDGSSLTRTLIADV